MLPDLKNLIDTLKSHNLLHSAKNGFWAVAGHMGTHTKRFARFLAKSFKDFATKTPEELGKILEKVVEAIEKNQIP
ncbi:MAG: hypothetical protein R3C17_03895 [Planctomycetaceae bacterium]